MQAIDEIDENKHTAHATLQIPLQTAHSLRLHNEQTAYTQLQQADIPLQRSQLAPGNYAINSNILLQKTCGNQSQTAHGNDNIPSPTAHGNVNFPSPTAHGNCVMEATELQLQTDHLIDAFDGQTKAISSNLSINNADAPSEGIEELKEKVQDEQKASSTDTDVVDAPGRGVEESKEEAQDNPEATMDTPTPTLIKGVVDASGKGVGKVSDEQEVPTKDTLKETSTTDIRNSIDGDVEKALAKGGPEEQEACATDIQATNMERTSNDSKALIVRPTALIAAEAAHKARELAKAKKARKLTITATTPTGPAEKKPRYNTRSKGRTYTNSNTSLSGPYWNSGKKDYYLLEY